MKKKVVIFGIGEFAEVMHFYLTHDSPYEVVAFAVDAQFIKSDRFCNLPVVATEQLTSLYSPSEYAMLVVIGYSGVNANRTSKYEQMRKLGYQLISYVSSKATVWPGLSIGDNCMIFEDNTIQPFTKIGNNVIMWSGNHLGHHSQVQDHCFITSHVVISGGVTIGEGTFIGVNATLRDHIKVGKNCVIGAASIIMKDAEDYSVFKPARTEASQKKSTDQKL